MPRSGHVPDQAPRPRKPSAEEILAARNGIVPDLIAPRLKVLFCGINPSLYSAAVAHHFARPGNRFWPALYRAGFTTRLLHPTEGAELLQLGYGITNIVDRATTTAAELADEELIAGSARLSSKVEGYRPAFVAFLGVTAYRTAFRQRQAMVGPQDGKLRGAGVWILPNPSGLNAHYTPEGFAREFAALRHAIKG